MSHDSAVALAIIAKIPRATECKTRLVPPLTHADAAALSACFLYDTAENVRAAASRCGATPAILVTGEATAAERERIFGSGMRYLEQRGPSFGERIAAGVVDFLSAGFHGSCIIDSDSPTLPTAYLEAAARALAEPGDRVVLGPAEDGGYYLIGLNAVHPEIFTGIDWSTEHVLPQTLDRARAIGLPHVLLPPWYDVDDERSLLMLRHEFDVGVPRGGYHAGRSREFVTTSLAGAQALHS